MKKFRLNKSIIFLLSLLLFGTSLSVFSQNKTDSKGVGVKSISKLPSKDKRWALIIGVDKYTDESISSLSGAANDAKTLADSLIKYAGFPEDQIILLTTNEPSQRQPSRANILKRLSNLKSLVPNDGLLLVSFSGHGIERNNRAFLIPADATSTEDIDLLEETAISVDSMKRQIKATGVQQVLFLLDACRNDPTSGRSDSSNPLTEAYKRGFSFDMANKEVEAFATIYATSVGARAYEYSEKRQGYFSWAIIEGLSGKAANEKGEVTLGSLVKYIENRVPKLVAIDFGAGKLQRPFAQIEGYKADELILSIVSSTPLSEAPKIDVGQLLRWEKMLNSSEINKLIAEATNELSQNPNNFIALRMRSNAYYANDNIDAGKADAEAVLRLLKNPKTAEEYEARCHTYRRLEKLDEGIADCNEAIRLNPNYYIAFRTRGVLYHNKKNYDLAIQDYNKAIQLNPNDAFAYNNRGNAYSDKQNYDQAIQDYNKAIQLNPNDAFAYNNRGVAYANKQNYDQAIQDYNKAIQQSPNFAIAYNNRGIAYRNKQNFDQAIQDFSKYIQLVPNDSDGYRNRSIAYDKIGETAKAEADRKKAAELEKKP